MGNKWNYLPFTEAVEVNPSVPLKRGKIYPFVDMKAVESSRRGASESESREFKSGGARFMPFDTLMARITPCLENGKIARYIPSEGVGGPAFGSTEFIVIRGREGVTDNDYAYYLTKWEEFRQFAISQMTGSSGRQRVPADSLAKFLAPAPESLSEQRAIAHILGSLDDKIELNQQMAQTLESIARAIFKSWFVDFDPVKAKMEGKQPEGMTEEIAALFPDRLVDSELEMIPEGWDIATMQDLGTIKGGATPSTKNPDYWEGGTNHWITPKDMSNLDSIVVLDTSRKITDSGMQRISSRQLPAGTVLMSSRAPVGYLAISAIPISINQGFIAIVCNKSIPNSYVLYLLESNMDKIKMSSGGSTFSEISKRNFRPIKILLPNKDLLVKFNEIIEPIVDKMTRLQREVTTLSSLRDALLPKLISGELRIKDFERFLGKVA